MILTTNKYCGILGIQATVAFKLEKKNIMVIALNLVYRIWSNNVGSDERPSSFSKE